MSFIPVLIQVAPAVQEPTLRGIAAIESADGWWVAVIGMIVVFSALFALFLLMKLLIRLLDAPPAPTPAQLSAPAQVAAEVEDAVEIEGPSPQLIAAIAVAVRLEQQRRASANPVPQHGVSGWVVSRSLQWAAHQRIFQRSRS
jgi:Na+-transporting methylmalonyl-CoA/oxaloacetate decarboxylase gamma subunit